MVLVPAVLLVLALLLALAAEDQQAAGTSQGLH